MFRVGLLLKGQEDPPPFVETWGGESICAGGSHPAVRKVTCPVDCPRVCWQLLETFLGFEVPSSLEWLPCDSSTDGTESALGRLCPAPHCGGSLGRCSQCYPGACHSLLLAWQTLSEPVHPAVSSLLERATADFWCSVIFSLLCLKFSLIITYVEMSRVKWNLILSFKANGQRNSKLLIL